MKTKLLIMLCCMITFGCTVTNSEIKQAEELCKNNEGLDYIFAEITTVQARCLNDASFTLK